MKNQKSNVTLSVTYHLLIGQFGNRSLITLEEVADNYLGIAYKTALQKARDRSLPFPVFKMGMSQKSPFVVHLEDLVKYIDCRTYEAREEWKLFNA